MALQAQTPSYLDFLASLRPRWPELEPLSEYLDEQHDAPTRQYSVLDVFQDRISWKRVSALDEDLWSRISDFEDQSLTKVIVVAYDGAHSENLDRRFLRIMGSALDLDPRFLLDHFRLSENGKAGAMENLLERTSLHLLQDWSFEIGFEMHFHASALILEKPQTKQRHILILWHAGFARDSSITFERPHLRFTDRVVSHHSPLEGHYLGQVLSWSPSTIAAAQDSPFDFVLPLVNIYANYAKASLLRNYKGIPDFCRNASGESKPVWDEYTSHFEYSLYSWGIRGLSNSLKETLLHLESLAQKSEWATTSRTLCEVQAQEKKLNYCLEKNEAVLKQMEDNLKLGFDYRNQAVARSQMREAQSVTRLTYIAAIFIPLSLVSSVFGMNVKEFGTGVMTIKEVIACAAIVLIITVLLWILAGPFRNFANRLTSGWLGVWFRRRCLRFYVRIDPIGAFWLFIYTLLNDPETSTYMMRELGIRGVVEFGDVWEQPRYLDVGSASKKGLGKFWQHRFDKIANVTRHKGWEKVGFMARFMGRTSNDLARST